MAGISQTAAVAVGELLTYVLNNLERMRYGSFLAAGSWIGSGAVEAPGGVFVRRRDALDADALATLAATARVEITCDGRTIGRILKEARGEDDEAGSENILKRPSRRPSRPIAPDGEPLLFENGIGGLTVAGNYRMRVRGDHVPRW